MLVALTEFAIKELVHNDIKPENIGVNIVIDPEDGKAKIRIKIMDFGSSRKSREQAKSSSILYHTKNYSAVETLIGRDSSFTAQGDAFAFGNMVVQIYLIKLKGLNLHINDFFAKQNQALAILDSEEPDKLKKAFLKMHEKVVHQTKREQELLELVNVLK